MANIPPSGSDYQRKIAQGWVQGTEKKTYTSTVKGAGDLPSDMPIAYLPKDATTVSTVSLGMTPIMKAPATPLTSEAEAAGLNTMADQLQNTPRMAFTLYQAESLMNVQSKLDPNVTAALLGKVQNKVGPEEFAQVLEYALSDPSNFNLDGTPTENLQSILNGEGMGQLGMKDNVPDAAKQALIDGDAASDESKAALEQYLSDCLDKGFGGGKLSPMFALMLLLTQYNNMRSLMDDKLAMVRQQFIKAGYAAQQANIMAKAYVALVAGMVTLALTVASVGVQAKGLREDPVTGDEKMQKLTKGKEKLDEKITDLKDAVKKNQDKLRCQEIDDDLKNNPPGAESKYMSDKAYNEIINDKDNPQDAAYTKANYKPAPDDVCDANGNLDLNKLGTNVPKSTAELDNIKGKLETQEKNLDELESRAVTIQRSIDERSSVLMSKHNTENQTQVTVLQGFIQFVGSMSQFGQSFFDAKLKGFEYQVTEDTFYQRQLDTNKQQSDQSIASLRQSAAQIEESTSGTLSNIGRSMV